MPKTFVRKTFDAWLEENIDHFKFKPYIWESRKRYFCLRFDGLDPCFYVLITKNGNVEGRIVNKHDELRDIISEFDLYQNKTDDGMYYSCLALNPTFYPDRRSLWRKHAFDEMLSWINTIDETFWLYLEGNPKFTGTSVRKQAQTIKCYKRREKLGKNKFIFHACFPLVVDAGEWVVGVSKVRKKLLSLEEYFHG